MVDIGIPNNAANFYSMLSGLGDQIAANRKQAQVQSALDAANQPGVSYGDAIRGLVSAGALPQAQIFATQQAHQDAIARQQQEDARQAQRDKINDQHWGASYQLQKANNDRLNQSDLEKAQEREKVARQYGIDPASPEGRAFVATGSFPPPPNPLVKEQTNPDGSTSLIRINPQGPEGPIPGTASAAPPQKLVPFETLGGTKFMAPQPNGGYAVVDPQAIARQGGPTGPSQPASIGVPPPNVMPAGPAAVPPGAVPQSISPPIAQPVPPQAAAPADLEAVDPKTGRREAWLASQPSDVQAYIKKIADYEVDPRTTSIKGGHREQVMSAVARYDPTYNQNEFGTRAKAMKDFGTGPLGNSVRSFDVGISHLDTLQKYVTALNSGDLPLINSLRNLYLQQTGSSLPTNVQAVGPIVGAEVSKAIIGSNNALADREELRKPLLGNGAPGQILDSIKAYKELMGGQLKGLKKQYEDTTGKNNFTSRISESTRTQLLGSEGDKTSMVDHAKAAIAAGAPRDKVIERLKAAGIDPGDI